MSDLLEVHKYDGVGYQPLVFFDGWQAALLNWEPLFDLANAGEIERHNQTDEVFVLWRGRALIFVSDGERLHAEEMQPGAIYNVPQGVWHNLLATRDASWIIVENRDTHLGDTELRTMTPAEWAQLRLALPAWVEENA
jgi:mannose-6-phosphate isomerase-like protein (cupin superfamily)